MIIINRDANSTYKYSNLRFGFFIKIKQLPNIWLFNCYEGCQNILIQNYIKSSQISTIILTELNTENIGGLLGLLSSLSLSTRIKKLDIYGPIGLSKYICLGRKYSQTNFRYTLQIHNISTGLISSNLLYKIYAFAINNRNISFNYNIINAEKIGKFSLMKAIKHRIPIGPLYRKLKIGHEFILPDGLFIYGNHFISQYTIGNKITLISNYGTRLNYSISRKSKVMVS